MKTVLAIVAGLLLTGCATRSTDLAHPVELPPLPPTLAEPAHRLPPLNDPTLKGMTTSGADSDAAYNALAKRYNALLAVYRCAQVALTNGTAISGCLR